MATLTLTVDQSVLERARRYAERHDTSISALVVDFLSRLPADDDKALADLPPITRRLVGRAAQGPGEADYHEHILKKYGS